MGVVYRAFDERLQRQVAVKEIAGSDARRILREAQAAARLNHPGIVALYELGSEDGRALLVSEFVDGATLAELAASGDLSDRETAAFGADVCDALGHAHARGVIHRDVKPQNVVVQVDAGAGRRAKLMDFGIASLAGATALTATGEVVGTLAYMAPEQAEGELVAETADVYSLALSLYECWAGVNPVAGQSPAQTARQIGSVLPELREHRPDLPDRLTSCIDACLDPEPAARPPRRSCASSSSGGCRRSISTTPGSRPWRGGARHPLGRGAPSRPAARPLRLGARGGGDLRDRWAPRVRPRPGCPQRARNAGRVAAALGRHPRARAGARSPFGDPDLPGDRRRPRHGARAGGARGLGWCWLLVAQRRSAPDRDWADRRSAARMEPLDGDADQRAARPAARPAGAARRRRVRRSRPHCWGSS